MGSQGTGKVPSGSVEGKPKNQITPPTCAVIFIGLVFAVIVTAPTSLYVITGIVLVILALTALGFTVAAWRRARLRRKLEGRVILYRHDRRGWRDFCINHVLPSVPADVEVVSDRYPVSAHRFRVRDLERRAGFRHFARPYLLTVHDRRVRIQSLNRELLAYKAHARRDAHVQRQVADLLGRVVDELRLRA